MHLHPTPGGDLFEEKTERFEVQLSQSSIGDDGIIRKPIRFLLIRDLWIKACQKHVKETKSRG